MTAHVSIYPTRSNEVEPTMSQSKPFFNQLFIALALLELCIPAIANAQDIININPALTPELQNERVRLQEKKQIKKSLKGQIISNHSGESLKERNARAPITDTPMDR